jgi:hypothetical protein
MLLYANGLRARHHITGKTTFRTLCAGAHKVRETRPLGSVRGVLSNEHSYRDKQPPSPWKLCFISGSLNDITLGAFSLASPKASDSIRK